MSSAIMLHQDPQSFASELPAVLALAKALINGGGFLPAHIKSEGEVVAVVLAGRELGMPPMSSIRCIRLIKGQVVLDAALQLALMIRAGASYKWVEDGRAGRATLEVKRAGQEPYLSVFEIADAERAGLVKDDSNWKKWPAAMLRARAVSGAGKAYFPDVLAGVYVPGEIEGDEWVAEPEAVLDRPKTLKLSESTPASAEQQASMNEAMAMASKHGFVPMEAPTPTKAERIKALLDHELPKCVTIGEFAAFATELVAAHRSLDGSLPWREFAKACADREVSPREAWELSQQNGAAK